MSIWHSLNWKFVSIQEYIYRLKIYGASDSSQGDFPVLLDTIVESPELLRDTTSPSGFLRSGYFINQTHTDLYWNSYGGDGVDSGLNPVPSRL